MTENYAFKICMGGDKGTGKTTLLNRYINSIYNPEISSTIGMEFYRKKVPPFELQIWDFGGHKKFREMVKSYTEGMVNFVLVVDSTNEKSLKNIEPWISVLRTHGLEDMGIIALSKCDLTKETEIEPNRLKQTGEVHDLTVIKYSAKTGAGVEDVFNAMINQIIVRNHIDIPFLTINKDNIVYQNSTSRRIKKLREESIRKKKIELREISAGPKKQKKKKYKEDFLVPLTE
ncbi:MAG: GTP-binding protein, partial [Candidatus Lokiarchaeota archaeon]|nr:GTP-binding protein [Candidatus Lokiarchaeota archaeon]